MASWYRAERAKDQHLTCLRVATYTQLTGQHIYLPGLPYAAHHVAEAQDFARKPARTQPSGRIRTIKVLWYCSSTTWPMAKDRGSKGLGINASLIASSDDPPFGLDGHWRTDVSCISLEENRRGRHATRSSTTETQSKMFISASAILHDPV